MLIRAALAVAAMLTLAASGADAGERVVIGKISTRPAKQLPQLAALADHLEATIEGLEFDVLVVPTVEAAIEAFERGELHMVSETVFGALQLERSGAAKVRLAEWKDGQREYHSVIVARADSDIASAEDLRGRRMLFQDETSSSGHFLPRLDLAARGFAFEPDGGPVVDPAAIRFGFAGEAEQNLVIALARKLIDAIALADKDWNDPLTVPAAVRGTFRVVHATAPMLRSTTVLGTSLSEETAQALTAALVALDEHEDGADVLDTYYGVSRFEPIEGRHLELLTNARSLYAAWPGS